MVLRNVAITGVSGMLGRHVIEVLSEKKISCSTTSRKRHPVSPPGLVWTPWDLSEWKTARELDYIFKDVQVVLHIGAFIPKRKEDFENYQLIVDVNVRSCLCLGKWALERDIAFLFVSSATVYSDTTKPNIKETDEKTRGGFGGFYGYSKLLAEETLHYFVKDGLRLCVFRPSSIYGYGLPEDKMITKFLLRSAQGKAIKLEPPVEDKINIIHAYDFAASMVDALKSEAWGVFNIASETSHSILDIAKTCVQVVKNGQVKIINSEKVIKPISRFDLNCDAAKKAFGFTQSMDLLSGVRKMWNDMNT